MANIRTPIPSLKLNDGNSIPMLAFGTGTAYFKRGDENVTDDALIENLKKAISMGYRHLDGADAYQNERELGKAVKDCGVDRKDLFITTKVHKNVGDIPSAIKTSLSKLNLEYVDLYLIHAPFRLESDAAIQQAWADMEEVKASGLAKSIGVSNFLPKHLDAILKTAKVTPAINQIEFHPYLQHPELLDYHKEHGIATAAYAPLTNVSKAKPGPVDDFVAACAKKYAVSEGEIGLRWCMDQDIVAITTSGKEQRMSDYLRSSTFKLTPVEIKEICKLGEQKHYRGFWTDRYDPNDRS